ncbi:MAG TPA: transposase family protein [Streptosporangiaceae bacterium]
MKSRWARAALSHRICTGIGSRKLGKLIEELAPLWVAQQESRLRVRRGRDRLRAEGAGPGRELPFADRVIATLVVLRFQLPHAALAVLYGVHRSTVTRAVGEIRPLLAQRGFAVPGQPGLRLATLADVFACAAAEGVKLRIDGTEVQVRRPPAGRPGRRAFVSGKKKQNTGKATVISDGAGRLLWLGAFRPGRMHDVTALRTEGIEDLLRTHPDVAAEVDAGYRGLAGDFPAQVSGPPKKPGKDASPDETARWEQQRHQQSSQRICVEHAIAEPKQWRTLQRYLGRREHFQETALAIGGLVSDRAAAR